MRDISDKVSDSVEELVGLVEEMVIEELKEANRKRAYNPAESLLVGDEEILRETKKRKINRILY